MDDDFNAPLAVGVLFDLAHETNQMLNSEQKMSVDSLKKIDRIFSELGGKFWVLYQINFFLQLVMVNQNLV